MQRYSVVHEPAQDDRLAEWLVIEWLDSVPGSRAGRIQARYYDEELALDHLACLEWAESQAIYAEFG